jgi:hypothetical protein
MSLQDVSPEQLAELFHHYHQLLAPDCESNNSANDETWQCIPKRERKRGIAAARLALSELRAEAKAQEDRCRYFAKPGEAEWGC